jgi:hypothetical protein
MTADHVSLILARSPKHCVSFVRSAGRVLLDRKGRISRAGLAYRTGRVLAAVLSLAGLLYAHHLANKFDRELGPKDKPRAE